MSPLTSEAAPGSGVAVISSYRLLRLVAAELRPLLRLLRFLVVWGLIEAQAEDSRALPLNRPLCAALEPVKDFMPLPARLEMEPNMLGVVEPSLPSPSLFSGIVEDLTK